MRSIIPFGKTLLRLAGFVVLFALVSCTDGPTEPSSTTTARFEADLTSLELSPSQDWEEVAGPWTVERTVGPPREVLIDFEIQDYEAFGAFYLLVRPTEGLTGPATAWVQLDEEEVFSPAHFSASREPDLTSEVSPEAAGTLAAKIAGAPGSGFKISLVGAFKPGWGRIGPAGGTLFSDQGDAWIVFPEGALESETIMSLVRQPDAGISGLDPELVVPGIWAAEPEGLAFDVPVSFYFEVPDDADDIIYSGGYYYPEYQMFTPVEGESARPGELLRMDLPHFSFLTVIGGPVTNPLKFRDGLVIPTKIVNYPEYLKEPAEEEDYRREVVRALNQYEQTLSPSISIDFVLTNTSPFAYLEIQWVDPDEYSSLFLVDGEYAAGIAGWKVGFPYRPVVYLNKATLQLSSFVESRFRPLREARTSWLVEGTVLHEIGHLFGLRDNPTSEPSLMNYRPPFPIAPTLRCYELGQIASELRDACADHIRADQVSYPYLPGEKIRNARVQVVNETGDGVPGAPVRVDFSNDEHGRMLLTDSEGWVTIPEWDPNTDGHTVVAITGVPDVEKREVILVAEEVSQEVIYEENFDSDPGFTMTYSPKPGEHFEWKPGEGLFEVRILEENGAAKWATSPAFGEMNGEAYSLQVDLRVLEQSWGMPIGFRGDLGVGTNTAWSIGHSGTRGVFSVNDVSPATPSYQTPTVGLDIWYRVTVAYDGDGAANIEITERASGAVVASFHDVSYEPGPFSNVSLGDNTINFDGRAATMQYDNIKIIRGGMN